MLLIAQEKRYCLNVRMKGNKTYHHNCLQYVDIYFDASIQDSQDYTIYKLPRLSQVSAAITAPVNIMKTKGVAYPTYNNEYTAIRINGRRKDMCDVDSILILNTSAGGYNKAIRRKA